MPAKKRGAHDHGPSIKHPNIYEALRREGMDKSKAAAISNSTKPRGRPKKK